MQIGPTSCGSLMKILHRLIPTLVAVLLHIIMRAQKNNGLTIERIHIPATLCILQVRSHLAIMVDLQTLLMSKMQTEIQAVILLDAHYGIPIHLYTPEYIKMVLYLGVIGIWYTKAHLALE